MKVLQYSTMRYDTKDEIRIIHEIPLYQVLVVTFSMLFIAGKVLQLW